MPTDAYLLDRAKSMTHAQLTGAARLLDGIIERAQKARNLSDLWAVHEESRELGFLNPNLDDDPYGMFRPEEGSALDPDHVFLGNIYGIWTKPLSFFEEERKKGSMDKDTYECVLKQYREILVGNFRMIQAGLQQEIMWENNEPKSLVGRLFRRNLHPLDGTLEESPFPHLGKEEHAYCKTVGVWPGAPEEKGHGTAGLNDSSDAEKEILEPAHNKEDVKDTRIFIQEMTREKALEIAGKNGLAGEVKYEMDHNGLTPGQALYEWDITPAPEELGQESGLLMNLAFNVFERKEILSKEFSKNYTRLFSTGSARSMAAPQNWDGVAFKGENAAYLLACLQSRPDWQPLFLSREDMNRLGVRPYEGSEYCSVLHREAGSGVIRDVVWNIADTNYAELHPGEYAALCQALSGNLSAKYDTQKAQAAAQAYHTDPKRYELSASPLYNPHLSSVETEVVRALVENVFGTAAGYSGRIENLKSVPFKGALAVASAPNRSGEGGQMYPAYEIHRQAGRVIEAIQDVWKEAYPRTGVDCEALVQEFRAARKDLARQKGESSKQSSGIKI